MKKAERREKAGKGGKDGFGNYAIRLLAKIVSKRTTGHRVPVHYNTNIQGGNLL